MNERTNDDAEWAGARRAELVAGALAGDLTPAEAAELDALRAADPSIDSELAALAEVAELRVLLGATTDTAPGWDESAPSAALRDRVLSAADDEPARAIGAAALEPVGGARPAAGARASARRRRPWLALTAAAACVALGVGGGLVGQSLFAPQPVARPVGGPGTLGALEPIAFVTAAAAPTGVDVDGDLVAHTWGTETILHIEGLTEAVPYSVVLVTESGERLESGSFLGSVKTIDCAMNAAVMREAVTSVEITDAGGAVVATAALPAVA